MAPKAVSKTNAGSESSRSDTKKKSKTGDKSLKIPAEPPRPQKTHAVKSLILRAAFETDSEKQGDLAVGTQCYILEMRDDDKGMKRAQVAMTESAAPLGWVTMAKDGVFNLEVSQSSRSASPPLPSKRGGAGSTPPIAKGNKAPGEAPRVGAKAAKATPSFMKEKEKPAEPSSQAAAGAKAAPKSTGSMAFMAATSASSTATLKEPRGTTAAKRRQARLERQKAMDQSKSPELEDVEDFDWTSNDGGWTVEKWLSSLQLHMILAGAFASEEDDKEPDPVSMRRVARTSV